MTPIQKLTSAAVLAFTIAGIAMQGFAQNRIYSAMEKKLTAAKAECRILEEDLSRNANHVLDADTFQLFSELQTGELVSPVTIIRHFSEPAGSDTGGDKDWIDILGTEAAYCLDSVLVLNHYNQKYMGARIPAEIGLATKSIFK